MYLAVSGTTITVNGTINTYNIVTLDAANPFTIIETFNGVASKQLYINGVLVNTSTTSKNITDNTWILGAHSTLTSTYFKGYIGDHGIKGSKISPTEVALLDEHQRRRWRVPSDSANYIMISAVGQSNNVGFASVTSDSISSGIGLNYIPSIRQFRDTNDKSGDDGASNNYTQSSNGSYYPPMVTQFGVLGKKVAHITTAKTQTSIATTSSATPGDRTMDWGSGSTLRSNFVTWTNAMLKDFYRGKLDWCIINQGERDVTYMASDATWTKALYKATYLDLINFIKTNYPGVKILIIQTVQARNTSTDAALNTSQWTDVITAQQELAASESNVFIIQDNSSFTITNGNLNSVDGIHYSKAGNVIMGQAVANKIYNNL
jgi:lysophospholipase L1-like esterase